MATVNRISEKDTIRAKAFNKRGQLIATVYDSGFSTVKQVLSRLSERCSGISRMVEAQIVNEDKEWSDYYTPSGKKISY